MAEVQKMHDCMEAGGSAMHGAIAEEHFYAGQWRSFNYVIQPKKS
jgi:hypothetical protein